MGSYGQPTDGMLLNQLAGGFAPVSSGLPHTPTTGFEGIPGSQQPGLMGMFTQSAIVPRLEQMMGQYGYAPMGLGHDMNVYDAMRHQQFTKAQREAMRIASESDRDGHLRTFRGVAAMSGTPWGAQQRRAARQLADTAGHMSPLMAEMFPDLLDQMGGQRGSATVMSQRMMLGNRYRIDPVTGRMGQTAESSGQLTRSVFNDLYQDGKLADMNGITAGQLGTMYDEMTRRGMIEGPSTSTRAQTLVASKDMLMQDPGGLEKAAMRQNVTLPANLNDLGTEELDKLKLDPAIEGRLRAFDAERVKRSLKSYVDAVGAVRDIFGDMGRPNAPMAELIKALEAMTQNGVGKLDPGRLSMMVRTTSELAKQSGMTIDQAMAMQQHAASRAEQLGVEPIHAIQAAQGGMAWGSAFRAQGGAATPAWGRMSADQMTQLDTNLRVQAAASEQAQRLAVMMRVRDRIGGFEQGSTAEAMSNAIMMGQTEFLDPKTEQMQSTLMGGGEFSDIMQGAKGRNGQNLSLDEGTLSDMMNQRFTNEEYIEKHGIIGQVRRQQTQDINEWLGLRYSESVSQRLRAAGMDEGQAAEVADKASAQIVDRMGDLSHGDFADSRTRTNKMADIIKEEVSMAGGRDFIQEKNLGEDFFQLSAEKTYGYINRSIRTGQLRGFENYQNVHAVTNEETQVQATRNAVQAHFQASIAEALAPLGRGTVLQRAVQYVQEAGPDAEMGGLISKAFGGVATTDIRAGLQVPLEKVRSAQNHLEQLHEQYAQASSGEEQTRIMSQIEAQSDVLQVEANNLVNTAGEFGIFTDGNEMLSPKDAQNVLDSTNAIAIAQQDLAGLSGDFAHHVSAAEVKDVQGTKFDDMNVAAKARYDREIQTADKIDDENKVVQKYLEDNPGKFANKSQAATALIKSIKENITLDYERFEGNYSTESMTTFMEEAKIAGDDEAKQVILARRSQVLLTPDDEEIETYITETGADIRTAETVLTARKRAKRFGLSETEIEVARKLLPEDSRSEDRAIQLAIQKRMSQQLDVSTGEFDQYVADHLELEGATNEAVLTAIRVERQDEAKLRWKDFWESDSGAVFRSETEDALIAEDGLNTNVIMSKAMTRKLGPQAIERFKTIRKNQERRQELATLYTDGDLTRLVAGDLTNITDPDELTDVRLEFFDIQESITREVASLRDSMGKEGRQWGEDTDITARQLLELSTDIEATFTQEQEDELYAVRRDIAVAQQLTAADIAKLEKFQTTHEALSGRVEAFGVTGEEMARYLSTGEAPAGKEAIFTPLTEAENELVATTYKDWSRATAKHLEITSQLKVAEQELSETTEPEERVRIEAEIEQLTTAKAEAVDKITKVIEPVAELAKARGMKSDELLQRHANKSLILTEQVKSLKDTFIEQKTRADELTARAKEIEGADGISDLKGGLDALERVDAMSENFREQENTGTSELLKGIFKRTGLDTEEHREIIGNIATRTGTETGRRYIQRIIATADKNSSYALKHRENLQAQAEVETDPGKKALLQKRAADLEGEAIVASGELFDQYAKVQESPERLKAFIKSIGLESDAPSWDKFKSDVEFYRWTGLDALDDLKPGNRVDRLDGIIQSLDRGAQYQTPQVETGENKNNRMTIDGTLTIVGDRADINAEGTRTR